MSIVFRDLLRKVGSGPHTSEDLSREEAATAMRMMLLQEATPAQIGAFLIAHRIKRPTSTELAGMLDAYEELGPRLSPLSTNQPVTVLGIPYDGRSRTAPLAPLTALVLATAGHPTLMHGGRLMPTKEGEPLISVWQQLEVDWQYLDLQAVDTLLAEVGLGFLYLPKHFPLAEQLVPYREQIGKRPPLATLELIWSPYLATDPIHLVAGFVHPPTEMLFQDALALRGTQYWTSVKGLEGSCDLPRERTAIVGLFRPSSSAPDSTVERLYLHARDYGFSSMNVPLPTLTELGQLMHDTLNGGDSEYSNSICWNSGLYLWQAGAAPDLQTGITLASDLLKSGKVRQTLSVLKQAIAHCGRTPSYS